MESLLLPPCQTWPANDAVSTEHACQTASPGESDVTFHAPCADSLLVAALRGQAVRSPPRAFTSIECGWQSMCVGYGAVRARNMFDCTPAPLAALVNVQLARGLGAGRQSRELNTADLRTMTRRFSSPADGKAGNTAPDGARAPHGGGSQGNGGGASGLSAALGLPVGIFAPDTHFCAPARAGARTQGESRQMIKSGRETMRAKEKSRARAGERNRASQRAKERWAAARSRTRGCMYAHAHAKTAGGIAGTFGSLVGVGGGVIMVPMLTCRPLSLHVNAPTPHARTLLYLYQPYPGPPECRNCATSDVRREARRQAGTLA